MHRDQCGGFVCGYWCLKGWNKPLKPTQQELILVWVQWIAIELFPAQLPPPLPGWDTSPPQHCSQWYVASLKKNYKIKDLWEEVKWEIVSWLRSKWLWATKLGKNYVVSKIYIKFLISKIMLKALKEILFKFFLYHFFCLHLC